MTDVVSGQDIARALEYLRDLTGDPAFDDALRALRSYGLDHALQRQSADVSAAVFGDPDEGYLAQMRYLVEHKRKGYLAALRYLVEHKRLAKVENDERVRAAAVKAQKPKSVRAAAAEQVATEPKLATLWWMRPNRCSSRFGFQGKS